MKRTLASFVVALFLSAASLAAAKDYQVTGPVVDVKDDAIIVKKGTEDWEIARDKNTKAPTNIKKGDRVMIKYKMTATSIESKEPTKAKTSTKAMSDSKTKTESKTK
jgi:GH43 family beta-xylosidase